MIRPLVRYVRPVNAMLAGFPPKPSGTISQVEWERLCSETAQYHVLGELGWGGSFGGAVSSAVSSVSSTVSNVAKPVVSSISTIKNIVTVLPKPTVFTQLTHAQALARRTAQALAREAAQPLQSVASQGGGAMRHAASQGGGAMRHAASQGGGAMRHAARPVQSVMRHAAKPFNVVIKPSSGIFNQMVGKVIPGVAPKPPQPSQWPAKFPDGFVANNQSEFDKHVADTMYLNPYSKRPISQSEYQLWVDAGANQWFVPAGWHHGDKLPDQAAIDAMKSADYADGYRPATQSEFSAYIAAVNAFNAQPQVSAPQTQVLPNANQMLPGETIAEFYYRMGMGKDPKLNPKNPVPAPTSISQSNGTSQISAPAPQPLTIEQVQSIASPAAQAQQVSAPAVEPMSIEQAQNLLNAPTQNDPGAAVAPKSGAPMGIIAAAAAGAFFLFKK